MNCTRTVLVLSALVAGCAPHDKSDDDVELPPPPYALRMEPPEPREETPTTLHIETATSDGLELVPWTGEITLTSEFGPVAPTTVSVVDGVADVDLVFEVAGFAPVTFSAPEIVEQVVT